MQDALTLLYDLILGVGGAYLGLNFLVGVVDLWQRSSPDYEGRSMEGSAVEKTVKKTVEKTIEKAVEKAVEKAPVPLKISAKSITDQKAVILPELTTQSKKEEQELEPVELVEDLEAPAPPNQLEM
ncbi:MAG: hypothetical protein AAGD25_32225 [Cyanobacteria bacterium P01_F01_bin.150]